jgi:Zn-dependent protease
MTLALFIQALESQPLFFICATVTVVVSICLHELAHGWAALWQGDETPRISGHMTWNPIVHMGWFSIILFLVAGIAFGLMPVNPSKFRSKYGEALVAGAGPAMNLLLALLACLGLGLWIRFVGIGTEDGLSSGAANWQYMLQIVAVFNVALLILNLIPIPPLDGSRILANFSGGYRRAINSVQNPYQFLFALVGLFVLLSYLDYGLFDASSDAVLWTLELISGTELELR